MLTMCSLIKEWVKELRLKLFLLWSWIIDFKKICQSLSINRAQWSLFFLLKLKNIYWEEKKDIKPVMDSSPVYERRRGVGCRKCCERPESEFTRRNKQNEDDEKSRWCIVHTLKIKYIKYMKYWQGIEFFSTNFDSDFLIFLQPNVGDL